MKTLVNLQDIRRGLALLVAASVLTLTACGGGGGGGGGPAGGGDTVADVGSPGDGGGIGGSGFSSSGTVDGTGSIFVNGERIDVDSAEFFIDGEPATEADLGLGMVVTVAGRRDETGAAFAERVDYGPLIEGAIDAIERNADNSSARLRVLGQVIIVERTSTVFEDLSFDNMTVGQRVELSGYRDDADRVRATRLEADDDIDDEVTLSGRISGLDGFLFSIGGQPVDASTASLDSLPGSALSEGLDVEVDGRLVDGVLVADDVDPRDTLQAVLSEGDDVAAQGPISNFQGEASFTVEGLPIDAGNASINTGGLDLANNLVVEVEGSWNGSVLVADTVTASRGRIELVAPLAAIDGNNLTLQFGNGTVTVATDNRTLLDDDRDGIEYLSLADLAIGDVLEVEALQLGNSLLATVVDRDDDDEDTEIQAPVQSFVEGVSVTLLGLTFDVTGAEFENAGDDDIDSDEFFRNLSVNDLLNVEDDTPADGFAESVEFEFAQTFDGEREFLDDDERPLSVEELPAAVLDFLAANFPGADIAFIEADDDEIELYLADGTEIEFDLDGGFIESDVDDDEDDVDEDYGDDDSADDDSDSGSDSDDALDDEDDAYDDDNEHASDDDASDDASDDEHDDDDVDSDV